MLDLSGIEDYANWRCSVELNADQYAAVASCLVVFLTEHDRGDANEVQMAKAIRSIEWKVTR